MSDQDQPSTPGSRDVPFLELLQSISLAVGESQGTENVLQSIVTGLVGSAGCALARIWLIQEGDICDRCPMRVECPSQTRCLHLRASAGRSLDSRDSRDWHRLDGRFRRFPLGVRKIGRVAASGKPEFVLDASGDQSWVADQDWFRRERIRAFACHPLMSRGDVIGVLGVFTRELLSLERVTWLGLFAHQAATSIANARAYEEIAHLKAKLELENEYLRDEVDAAHGFGDVVGQSEGIRKVLDQVALVGPADSTVLIGGESGTGKELIARALHERSQRKDRALIRVNCGSIPRELFESEFFGHVKGAFTGAVRDRIGRFQLADGGTLFLDEVGEIPLDLQSKLLRVLQEGTFERVGDDRTRKVNVRLIAATNRDLRAEVQAGRFREDLFYRLSVFPIDLPPLRERLDDIPLLADHFLRQTCRALGLPPPQLKKRHAKALQSYRWPGNIRELQNVIEREIIRAQSGPLQFDLPSGPAEESKSGAAELEASPDRILKQNEIKRMERDNVLAALDATNWKIYGLDGAAQLLGMRATTLASKIKALGLSRR
ncbi:MAG: GAF domain-containing protein [Acidobacteria bacterium]|nr:GAF domain-containing protein [Acidobacteriota bacterium]